MPLRTAPVLPRRAIALLAAVTLAFGAVSAIRAVAGSPATVIDHVAGVVLDTEAHTVHVTDRIEVPAGVDRLRLNADMTIEDIRVSDNAVVDAAVVAELVEDGDDRYWQLDLRRMGMQRGGLLFLVYGGAFFAPVDDVVFSRENVGGEISATIGDEGIYLSSSALWLPTAEEAMGTFDLTLDTPAGFETVTQGRRVEHAAGDRRLHTRWVADRPSDGINLIANRYHVHGEPVREGVTSYTFFLEDDARLRATYMERTKAYIAMYEEMIGPYPYAKFATVENWFPTGYGMPSYTLLGGQVLRLPFIPYTSFGHEIAHNWWGNSVFVDLDEGNWCEGLTVYCADYHYKELESPAAAREYRRNLLKDYAAYVRDPAVDFPLSEFRSRHSGATRAVGYGKSMMVFHMLDRLVGREAFVAGLREVAAEHKYSAAAWSDFLRAFAARGDVDVAATTEQWLLRTGAPELALSDVVFDGDEVSFTLSQGEPIYDLHVPVVVGGSGRDAEHVLVLDRRDERYTLAARGARRLAVDPDCHLFRHLDQSEIEPTISQILGNEAPYFVIDDASGRWAEAALEFARGFVEDDAATVASGGELPGGGRASVVINPGRERRDRFIPAGLEIAGKTAFLDGKRYDLENHDLVFATADPEDPSVSDLVIICRDPDRLVALARRVVHYGKYSWLALPAGQGRPDRGNWTPGSSPLMAAK